MLIAASEHLACQDYSSLHVMDACCGTGLVGAELARQGFGHVDGCDLSPAMVREAQKTAAYEALHAGIDLTIANASLFPDHLYDATLCCGAFIEGHLPARALDELIRITAPHGLVIFSTRRTFYEKEGFADLLDQWVANGELRPAGAIMDASYLDGVAAHYLAYSVCPH
ncbi:MULTISPECIES: class I SAM-dependent DNA methyltransferase [Pseudomonas]|uniref:class I SAM-dependent DNA methyltransferase n=1 Tax=Pseudomonas TaxID=286 RepID=UPI0012FEEB85|nr:MULTISPECIES: class I SAM-dependent methyltransferase [Pseudomonas]